MTTWYILAPIDQLCLHCPLPRCNENNPRCPRRQALAAKSVSQQKPVLREVQVLNYLRGHPQQRIINIAQATDIPYGSVARVLKTLQDKNQATATGQRKTRKWTAKPSQ